MTGMNWLSLFAGGSTVWLWVWIYKRITDPFKCDCGATFWVYAAYRKHVKKKHGMA